MLYLGLFLLAAASLGLEITLTRVFALAQWHHFGFMAISVALLGVGAGGTVLVLWPDLSRRPRRVAALAAIGCAAGTLGGYLAANTLPFDAYRIAWQPVQFLYLAAYYLALTVPFFCAGLGTGVLLAASAGRTNRVYAANLLGSAAGCGLAPPALAWAGGAGSVAVWAALAALAALCFARRGAAVSRTLRRFVGRRPARRLAPAELHAPTESHNLQHTARGARRPTALETGSPAALVLAAAILVLVSAVLAVARPAWFDVRLSPYKGLPQALQAPGASLVSRQWNALARVDVVAGPALHAAPGLSLACPATAPDQQAVFVDGDNPSPRLLADPASLGPWADCLPLALPFHLRPGADALVLEPGGNLDPLVAQSLGAGRVTVVEPNRLLAEAAGGSDLAVESGRSFLRRTRQRFDVVDLALSGSRNVVTTGAYSLSETYAYTVEGMADALARLDEDGLLVVGRWLQTPPSEELRAWALAVAALEKSGVPDPRQHLVALRSWSTLLILVKNGAFSLEEVTEIRAFCAARQFDLVYLPDLRPGEGNRYNVYRADPYTAAFRDLLDPNTRRAFYAAQTYDVRPPTDDRPFFFHFFTWRQLPAILRELGHTWKPFGGGGYLVLLALLGVSAVAGAILVLLPAALRVGRGGQGRARVVAYFGLLGLGYLAVEMPLLQRFILFLGHPTTAFAVVVAGLLLFSGIGSLLAGRVAGRRALLALVAAIVLTAVGVGPLFRALLGASLPVRVLATGLALAPLGLLLGLPFPLGLARLGRDAPGLLPWAWAVNGSASAVASVAVALGALSAGFSAVLVAAVVAYSLAAVLYRRA